MLDLIYNGTLKEYEHMGAIAGIPDHMVEPLYLYVEKHMRGGNFLTAVLSNDLKESISCADDYNKYCLHNWVMILHNCVPANCWGSREAVIQWLKKRKEV